MDDENRSPVRRAVALGAKEAADLVQRAAGLKALIAVDGIRDPVVEV